MLGVAVAAACVGTAFVVRSANGTLERSATRSPNGDIPQVAERAFDVPTPRPLALDRADSLWAPVLRSVVARRAPDPVAAPVARLETTTPEGTTNIVLELGRREDARGRLWVHVRLPVLPNNTTGWVRRDALGGSVEVDTHLVVDLERFTATLLESGKPVFRTRVGVGRAAWPTPRGQFYVRNKLSDFDNPFYGPVAFGLSARSAVLTDWPAGGFIGIHGTNRPELVPGQISHGCIRLRNEDIVRLAEVMPVGTPVTIR
jgi:L,D-transpeptidase catalytic domain